MLPMIKFKIFTDQLDNSYIERRFADNVLNDWLKKNPKVEIISYQYQVSKYGYNSICIMYKEIEFPIHDMTEMEE